MSDKREQSTSKISKADTICNSLVALRSNWNYTKQNKLLRKLRGALGGTKDDAWNYWKEFVESENEKIKNG